MSWHDELVASLWQLVRSTSGQVTASQLMARPRFAVPALYSIATGLLLRWLNSFILIRQLCWMVEVGVEVIVELSLVGLWREVVVVKWWLVRSTSGQATASQLMARPRFAEPALYSIATGLLLRWLNSSIGYS